MAYIKTHVYTRISKTSQQEGSGIDEQLSRIESYIKSKPEQFHDEPQHWQDIGLSAFKNKNIIDGQLAEFIQQVEEGSIGEGHALVIYSLDRLSRRSSWDEDTIQKLVKAGVDIHDVSTPVVLKHDDPFSKIIMELIVQRGNNESKIKSERSTSGWAKRLKDTIENGKVFTKQLPRWLAADKNNNYIVIPQQAEIIKRIFREYTNGMSSTMIARRLNDEELKSFSGSKWWHNTITNLIKDERLRGYFIRTVDSTKIPDIYPEIIDGELFTIANRILQVNSVGIKGRPRENNKTREIKNIITGFVLCGKCGSKVTTSKNPRGVSYVKCRGRRNDEIFCGQKSIKLIELERLVINYTKQLDMSKIFSYKEADTSLEASLQSELQSLEADEKACHENIEQRKKEKKTFLPLANALIDIQDRIDEIKNKLLELNVSDPLVNIKQFNLDDLMDASKIELRMSLRKYLVQVVDRITFRSIDENILIEIVYNKDVYRHVLITDSKVSEVLHEINIIKENNLIKYNAKNFSIIEDEISGGCRIIGLDKVNYKDYILLATYMDSLVDKRWIVDFMNDSYNIETVMANT
ncbi:recombinase family protein [Aeromonas hydrophila]|uniref:recombinase family protein n=1 Tax=Aeromonas hydrophila TaxID=644 RepID=UPI002B480252|nr:recombinase family protein [Aeromonas hydrophila]